MPVLFAATLKRRSVYNLAERALIAQAENRQEEKVCGSLEKSRNRTYSLHLS